MFALKLELLEHRALVRVLAQVHSDEAVFGTCCHLKFVIAGHETRQRQFGTRISLGSRIKPGLADTNLIVLVENDDEVVARMMEFRM